MESIYFGLRISEGMEHSVTYHLPFRISHFSFFLSSVGLQMRNDKWAMRNDK